MTVPVAEALPADGYAERRQFWQNKAENFERYQALGAL